jgi:hypothetical protein
MLDSEPYPSILCFRMGSRFPAGQDQFLVPLEVRLRKRCAPLRRLDQEQL